MKRGWFWAGCTGVAAAVLLVFSEINAQQDEEAAERSRTRIELDLSFARLQKEIAEGELTPEEARDAVAQWTADNADQLAIVRAEEEQKLADRRAAWTPMPMPQVRPDPASLSDEDFVAAANQYLSQAAESLWGWPETGEERETARDRVGDWMALAENVALKEEIEAARQRIAAANPPADPVVLSPEEIAQLDSEEGIREEIFSEQVRVLMREPLAEGEEFRDRLAEIDGFVSGKLAELRAVHASKHMQRIETRIAELELELEESN